MSKLYPSQPRQQNTLLQPSPQPISTEMRVNNASSTLYRLIVKTPLYNTSTLEGGQTSRTVRSRNAYPPPAQKSRACGTLDTTRPTIFLRITRESPPATSIDTCNAMVYLRPPLTRHSKLLWKRFARSFLPPTKQPTPTHSSTRLYVHIKQWPQRGKHDSPTSSASARRRRS
jgi:hypothetical protein